jgi:hypothetical protein
MANRLYLNWFSYADSSPTWNSEWVEVAPSDKKENRLRTSAAGAIVIQNGNLFAFAVGDGVGNAGPVLWNRPLAKPGWIEVDPPGFRTKLAVAAVQCNGRIVVCARTNGPDGQLYVNELPAGGFWYGQDGLPGISWSSWTAVPNSANITNMPPALGVFQNELYVFATRSSGQVIMIVHSAEGDWTEWAEVPSGGVTFSPVATTAQPDIDLYPHAQFYTFIRTNDNTPRTNVASETGTWSGWLTLPDPGLTDTAYAAAIPYDVNSMWLIGKGTTPDNELYWRTTTI